MYVPTDDCLRWLILSAFRYLFGKLDTLLMVEYMDHALSILSIFYSGFSMYDWRSMCRCNRCDFVL